MATEKKDEQQKAKTKGGLPGATREAIMGANDLVVEPLEVVDWGVTVYVHTLTGNERDAWEDRCVSSRSKKSGKLDIRMLKAKLVIASACDENGKRLFVDNDAEGLNEKSAKCIDEVFQVAQRISGLSNKEAEEIAGN